MADECATCGHPQSQHKTGKGGCRACDLGCARYEPETAAQPTVEPVPLDGLDLAKPDPGASTSARLVHAIRERDRLQENETRWAAEVESIERARHEARDELARVDIAAGRDIAKPDEPLVERVVDLRRGRTEATERALELSAELTAEADAHRETQAEASRLGGELGLCQVDLAQARAEIERLEAQLEHAEHYARDLQDNGDVPAGADALLARADATKVPAITATSDSIHNLLDRLREQLSEHDRLDGLRVEALQLEERLAEIRRVLAEAEQPPAPIVTDKTIREWARANGRTVDGRGRVSMELRAEYLRAHQSNESTITEGAPTA